MKLIENDHEVAKRHKEVVHKHESKPFLADWILQRKWLQKNKLPYEEMEQEIKYRELMEQTGIIQRIRA